MKYGATFYSRHTDTNTSCSKLNSIDESETPQEAQPECENSSLGLIEDLTTLSRVFIKRWAYPRGQI